MFLTSFYNVKFQWLSEKWDPKPGPAAVDASQMHF